MLPISSLDKVLQWLFYTGFFSFGGQKKWSLVALDRWSSYTITTVWELAWADSALVVLDDWLSYGGGRISRFDYITRDSGDGDAHTATLSMLH